MDTEKLIQNFISGNISREDRSIVENLLKTDADFNAALEKYRDVHIAFQFSEKKRLKKKFQEIENDINTPTKFRFLRSNAAYVLIAASVVIAIFFNVFNGNSGSDLFKTNFSPLPNTYQPIVRSNSAQENAAAFSAYENADYQLAQQEFEELLKSNPDPNIRFYYGLTLLNQSKYDLALEQFNDLALINYEYKAEELWYTALIYLKKEDFKSAKKTLEKPELLNSRFKENERKVLLEKIEEK